MFTVEPNDAMDMKASVDESLIDRYQRLTMNTAVYPEAGKYTDRELNYLILGLAGEAGELVNKFKKFVRKGHVTLDPERMLHLTTEERHILSDELGDVLWYLARCGRVLGLRIEEMAMDNYTKLMTRKRNDGLKDHA